MAISRELLDSVTSAPNFFSAVITRDETWIFEYDPETKYKAQSGTQPVVYLEFGLGGGFGGQVGFTQKKKKLKC